MCDGTAMVVRGVLAAAPAWISAHRNRRSSGLWSAAPSFIMSVEDETANPRLGRPPWM